MTVPRRRLLAASALLGAGGLISRAARAQSEPAVAATDPRMADRFIGKADAPVTVIEFSSLTCPHCAAFSREVLPQVQSQLVDTGKIKMIFRPFPLDKVALVAEQVARALPPARYEPFCAALFASQDRWAYGRGINTTEELAKMAALAGLSREAFDKAVNDTALQNEILQEQQDSVKQYSVDSTPTFIFNGPGLKDDKVSGEQTYDAFAKLVAQAAGS